MPGTAARTPTPQTIGALLKRSGFVRAAHGATGRHSGYEVTGWSAGDVRVRYHSIVNVSARQRAEMLGRYTEVLTAAGYAVATGTGGQLVVTAK